MTTGANDKCDAVSHQFDERLQSFDIKLDKIANALVTIARIEERQMTNSKDVTRLYEVTDKHEQQIHVLEQTTDVNKAKVSAGERMFWAVVTASLAGIAMLIVKTLTT